MTRRKTDPEAIINATIDRVLAILRAEPMVLNGWGGVELLERIEKLRSAAVLPAIQAKSDDSGRDGGKNGHAP